MMVEDALPLSAPVARRPSVPDVVAARALLAPIVARPTRHLAARVRPWSHREECTARDSRTRRWASESLDDWHWKARRVLSRFGPRTVPALVEALVGGDDPAIRLFAAESLALLGPDARGASEALRHAAGHDEDPPCGPRRRRSTPSGDASR